jgi:Mg2+/Co2+ transporter CorB
MTYADLFTIFAVVLCLLMSFFFSGSETALTASSRSTMTRLANSGNAEAGFVTRLLGSRDRLIGALLLGNNVANIAASTLATGLFLSWFGNAGVIYATVVMTVLVVVFCEVVPKTAAFSEPERAALIVARPMTLVVRALEPVLAGIEWLARRIVTSLGFRVGDAQPILSAREELRGAVDLFHQRGSVAKGDRDMLGGLLDLGTLTNADVMLHRTEMVTFNAADPPEKVVDAMLDGAVTRVPLWRGSPENIIGIVHARDVLRAIRSAGGDASKIDLTAIAMPPWFVPDIRPLTEQLAAFRRRKTPFALVVDEYGEVQGLVTLEDILEEIVGDIADEHDVELPGVRPQPDGSIAVDGSVPIRDLNRALDWNLPDDQATTIAGLVIHEARSIPDVGQSFTFHGYRFAVTRKSRNRIIALRVTPLARKSQAA